ncbi:unnamed protein product [Caenorhabditis sp. 36 PRJEB53466]|nr:unnamed protein product [Caenorhabditis sp. 36 PRJEB53466]
MADGDRRDNVFSDDDAEDSFDEPVKMTKSTESDEGNEEEEELSDEEFEDEEMNESEDEKEDIVERTELDLEHEDFDLVTIEKIPMKALTTRIGRVVSEILYRGEAAAIALFEVANNIVFQSTMIRNERNTVIEKLMHGFTTVITDSREREEKAEAAEHILMILLARVAIRNKSMKSDDLILQLVLLVDRLYLHADSFVRIRVCRFIGTLVDETNRYEERVREQGDTMHLFMDETIEEESVIPDGVRKRWMEKLAKSLLDKSPLVRAEVVSALSYWEPETVVKTSSCEEITLNELLWKSVFDVDENVRSTAAFRVHISEENIDKCMDYVETSRENKIRHEIAVRLATNVHVNAFTNEQRFRFINLLRSSDSARVRDIFQQRLVVTWMSNLADVKWPSMFPAPLNNSEVYEKFPSIILECLDPLVDQDAVYNFIKSAAVRFICRQSTTIDVEEFMRLLLGMGESVSESLGVMRRSTFRLIDPNSENADALKLSFYRIVITRSLLDTVFELSKGRLDSIHLRNRAVLFFVPDVTTFTEQLEQFCSIHFTNNQDSGDGCAEVLLNYVFNLLNKAVQQSDGLMDREIYKKTLERILDSAHLEFPADILMTMITTVLDLCKNDEEKEVTCERICESANKLLLIGEDGELSMCSSLEEAMKGGAVQDTMLFRCATMLLAACQHEMILEPTPGMSSLFKALIPALLGNKNERVQVLGLELIGFAATIDFENCAPYLKLTRYLIERDDPLLKVTCLHTLIRVIKSHTFPDTAEAIFLESDTGPKECHDTLANLVERTVRSLEGRTLAQAVQDCFSMLSHGDYAWQRLFSALLLTVFRKDNMQLQLEKVFKAYCKSSVRSTFSKINILQGFTKAVSVISKRNESDSNWRLADMTANICELLSTVPTVGEDSEEEKEIDVEIELAKRMIRRAVAHPSSWTIRHIFTSLATSLSLECVPIEQLVDVHNLLADSFKTIKSNSGKTTHIAVTRFINHCQKVINIQQRRRGLTIPVDLKKVKQEDPEDDLAATCSTSSGKKRGGLRKVQYEEDIDYIPTSSTSVSLVTKRRGRPPKAPRPESTAVSPTPSSSGRKRGRPRKSESSVSTTSSPTKRQRGRPRKSPSSNSYSSNSPTGRKRGRPRKSPPTTEGLEVISTSLSVPSLAEKNQDVSVEMDNEWDKDSFDDSFEYPVSSRTRKRQNSPIQSLPPKKNKEAENEDAKVEEQDSFDMHDSFDRM